MSFKQNPDTDKLFDVILNLKNKDECYLFFEDICTMKELSDMSQRLRVAQMLLNGHTYEQIVEKVEISSATISRINRCIQYGEGGYRLSLERISNKKNKE